MSRRDQWKEVSKSIVGREEQKQTVEERERMPDIACGFCKNCSEKAYESDGQGYCNVLKIGSNIAKDPPVLVTEGEIGFITMFNMDASRCPYFVRMEFVDTDGAEVSDPAFRRAHRQMEKK